MDDRTRHTLKTMETETTFDLNLAIRHWRDDLARSSAFRSENLNELESHLRDSIDRLRARELSDEEAFLIATRRIGNAQNLEQEFGKVNSAAVWFDRCLWILVALQLWVFNASASSLLLSIASPVAVSLNETLPGFGLPQISHDWLQTVLAAIISPVPTAILAILLWRIFIWPKRKGLAFAQKLLREPGKLALTLLVLCLAMHLAAAWAMQMWYYPTTFANIGVHGMQWRLFLWRLPGACLWAGLTYFIARKRLRSAAA
jgi:hypothetical protein